ncbi:MAG: hypothetical protein K6A43_12990 [Treponema sp.]|nr:hypothetical protein [Treponema sp.]
MKKMFKIAGVFAAFAMAIMFIGCSALTSSKSEEKGVISGKVVYSNSTDYSDIVVTIEKSDGLLTESVHALTAKTGAEEIESARSAVAKSVLATAKVSSNGKYSFTDLDAGTYTIYASSDNSEEKAVTTNVIVPAGREVVAADLKLTATGSISGKVTIDGKSTGNGGLIVLIPGTKLLDVTQDDGSYTIVNVPAEKQYNLAVYYGAYTYFVTSTVSTTAGQTKTSDTINIKSEDIINGLPAGVDGKNGENGTDGKNGSNGVLINWLGTFESAEEIKEPKAMDAYLNSKDKCSYIYVNDEWTLLARAGNDGTDGKDGADADENTKPVSETQYVSYVATEDGIQFSGTIMSNVNPGKYNSTYANATIEVTENGSGVTMRRNWQKTNNSWDNWIVTYPLVEEGKEYEFYVKVYSSDYTIYDQTITVKATGGLGEFKIENADKYTVELTEDRVIQRTGKPEFTKNEKVNYFNTEIYYEIYTEDWGWLYAYDGDGFDSTFPLKDVYKISRWRTFEDIDACLSGHNYRICARTYLQVRGFTDNGQTYFMMNDYRSEVHPWGGECKKIYILTDPKILYGSEVEIEDVPGEEMNFVVKNEKGEVVQNLTYKTLVINYNENVSEPLNLPYAKSGKSKFNYWCNQKEERVSFPNNFIQELPDGYNVTVGKDEEKVEYVNYMLPKMSLYFTVTMMDGDKLIGTEEVELGKAPKTAPEKDGFVFDDWYEDKELTTPCKFDKVKDVTVYANFITEKSQLTVNEANNADSAKRIYYSTNFKHAGALVKVTFNSDDVGTSKMGVMFDLKEGKNGEHDFFIVAMNPREDKANFYVSKYSNVTDFQASNFGATTGASELAPAEVELVPLSKVNNITIPTAAADGSISFYVLGYLKTDGSFDWAVLDMTDDEMKEFNTDEKFKKSAANLENYTVLAKGNIPTEYTGYSPISDDESELSYYSDKRNSLGYYVQIAPDYYLEGEFYIPGTIFH